MGILYYGGSPRNSGRLQTVNKALILHYKAANLSRELSSAFHKATSPISYEGRPSVSPPSE